VLFDRPCGQREPAASSSLPAVRRTARTRSLVMAAAKPTIRFVDTVHVFDRRALGAVRIG
jgi:hypothetical protein